MRNKNIELLAPAKNYEVGVAAINHGADAVYIGPDQFGARVSAGNSVADIERLASYAHRYHSKVFVTVNTILYDSELDKARRLIYDLYNAGVDALIIQDMALLCVDLPPISLHASTQCDNRTLEKVKFLEKCGFEQVVLARETTIDAMRRIAQNTNVTLEAFVHGALCVCYSGQCYMSQASKGRSANRGACAQMCRLPYSLIDDRGNVYAKNRHLLSLKDFDASSALADMIDAGISSFKIEGRLKDENYVKNITAFYRQKIDNILEHDTVRRRFSSGITTFFFSPNPQKTFYRGATDYFLYGRKPDIWQFNTPKSVGESIGKIIKIGRSNLTVDSPVKLSNGDGLCFVDGRGEFHGFRVNRVENAKVYPFQMPDSLSMGVELYRNQDMEFDRLMSQKTSERRIEVCINLNDDENGGVKVTMSDSDGYVSHINISPDVLQFPKDASKAKNTWVEQMSKFGETQYRVVTVNTGGMSEPWFMPVSKMADVRRQLAEQHTAVRNEKYRRDKQVCPPSMTLRKINISEVGRFLPEDIDYKYNVANRLSCDFYKSLGVKSIKMAYELEPAVDVELMRTKYCLRYAMGWCKKNLNFKGSVPQHLYLLNGKDKYELTFDCKSCEMIIKSANK